MLAMLDGAVYHCKGLPSTLLVEFEGQLAAKSSTVDPPKQYPMTTVAFDFTCDCSWACKAYSQHCMQKSLVTDGSDLLQIRVER